MLRWESVGGLVFDRKFSNCTYGSGGEPAEPGSRVSVTCVFSAPVAAGATVELSSPLTATVGKRVLTGVVDYSAGLLKPGVRPGEGRQGTGPALGLVPVSGAGGGFEQEGEGRFTVAADNSADFAATIEVDQDRRALDIRAVNHGPVSVYVVDKKPVVVVDVVLPKGMVGFRNIYEEGEDSPYGECLLRVSATETAPFEAGHRRYVCPVPFDLTPGKSQLFILRVKLTEDYDGAKGTATVRPGPAGVPCMTRTPPTTASPSPSTRRPPRPPRPRRHRPTVRSPPRARPTRRSPSRQAPEPCCWAPPSSSACDAGAPTDTAVGPLREAAHGRRTLTPRKTVYSFGDRARV